MGDGNDVLTAILTAMEQTLLHNDPSNNKLDNYNVTCIREDVFKCTNKVNINTR